MPLGIGSVDQIFESYIDSELNNEIVLFLNLNLCFIVGYLDLTLCPTNYIINSSYHSRDNIPWIPFRLLLIGARLS